MRENRVNPRFNSLGRVRIPDIIKKGIVKNISITGCCLVCTENTEKMKIGEIYEVFIKPEKSSHTGEFEINAECMWIRKTEKYSEIGLNITKFPKGRHFQNYVDYIAFHSASS